LCHLPKSSLDLFDARSSSESGEPRLELLKFSEPDGLAFPKRSRRCEWFSRQARPLARHYEPSSSLQRSPSPAARPQPRASQHARSGQPCLCRMTVCARLTVVPTWTRLSALRFRDAGVVEGTAIDGAVRPDFHVVANLHNPAWGNFQYFPFSERIAEPSAPITAPE